MKNKTVWKKRVALILSAAMITGVVPQMGQPLTVEAADGDKTITGLGISGIQNPTEPGDSPSSWSGNYVYFGNYEQDGTEAPVKYRVLDTAATEFYSANTTMLLDCDSILARGSNYEASWTDCNLRTLLNGSDFLDKENVFTALEKNVIVTSQKTEASAQDGNGGIGENDFDFAPVNDQIFLLDAKEATRASYGYETEDDGTHLTRKKSRPMKIVRPYLLIGDCAPLKKAFHSVRIIQV